jgi:hypothetical protein
VGFVLLIASVRLHMADCICATACVTAAVLLSGGRYGSLARCAESIGVAILSGYVGDNGTECDDNHLGQTVTGSVQKTRRRMIIAALKWTVLMLISTGDDKTKGGKVESSTDIRRILTKLPEVTGQARKATTPFEA